MENIQLWLNENGGAAILWIGVLLVVLLREVWRTWRFVRGSVATTGEVVAYETRQEEVSGEDRDYVRDVYAQIIRYTDRDGVIRTFSGPATATRKRHTIGTSIAVRYHPQQNIPAREDSFKAIYGRPITLMLIIAVIALFALKGS